MVDRIGQFAHEPVDTWLVEPPLAHLVNAEVDAGLVAVFEFCDHGRRLLLAALDPGDDDASIVRD